MNGTHVQTSIMNGTHVQNGIMNGTHVQNGIMNGTHVQNGTIINGETIAEQVCLGEYTYPKHYMGKPRPIRIILVGAGLSGIASVKIFKDMFKGKPVELVIYEKNHDVTGTWLENRYPGCACDVPAHAYGFSWEGNPNWSKAYVGAVELYEYFKGRAKAYGVGEFVRLNHKVTGAVWDKEKAKWSVSIQNLENQTSFTEEAEILINAAGFLNNWKWPAIPGLMDFQGKLIHSARWDDEYDFQGKVIGVVGSGSSAIQIVPQLQPKVKHLTSFNRSRTWITPEFAAEFAPEGRSAFFSERQKQSWSEDHLSLLTYRKKVESTMNKFFDLQFKDSEIQRDSFETFGKTMRERLGEKNGLASKLIPNFAVGCRRLTPGHGYLEALASDNVSLRTDGIQKVTSEGIVMADGTLLKMDAIICATGFDTSFRPPFPLIGPRGLDLRDVWEQEPRSYMSIAASGFPNYFITSGPNFPLANGCLIPCLEMNIKYAFKAALKMQREGIKSISPKSEAVDDYQDYKDSLMKDLVWSAGCRSWYKNGMIEGKVWGPWSGSSLHYLELMEDPRWEDWEIAYLSRNRYNFLGNGKTEREVNGGDLAPYLVYPDVEA